MQSSPDFDVTIVGAGVVGLACAHQLSRSLKGARILLIEKERSHGMHTSSRSSEQIHAGIYYKSDSLKAKLCLRGKDLLYDFLAQHQVPHKKTGKLFLAFAPEDLGKLEQTKAQAMANGLFDLHFVSTQELKELEPEVTAIGALKSPTSGIFDTHQYMYALLRLAENSGVTFSARTKLKDARFDGHWELILEGDQRVSTKYLVNCAGLDAIDIFKKLNPGAPSPELHASKGCFIKLTKASPVRHILYPAITPGAITERADATPDLQGRLKFGPTTDPVSGPEDYTFPENLIERMLPAIRKYLPKISAQDLTLDYCGIRPRIYGGGPPLDFIFDAREAENAVHLLGMESPALTSSLAIGEHLSQILKGWNP